MLALLKSSQLKSLKIGGSPNSWTGMNEYLINFLGTQTELEELALRDIDFSGSRITDDQIEAINLPSLKRLSLGRLTNVCGGERNAIKLLKSFPKTLEHIELDFKFGSRIYEQVFTSFQKLKSLDVYAAGLPVDENFYKSLRSLSSVKKLIIRDYSPSNEKSVQGLIGNLANIEDLIIQHGIQSNELMLFIASNLLQLKSLSISSFTGGLFKNV